MLLTMVNKNKETLNNFMSAQIEINKFLLNSLKECDTSNPARMEELIKHQEEAEEYIRRQINIIESL